jgi:hypothetical protein
MEKEKSVGAGNVCRLIMNTKNVRKIKGNPDERPAKNQHENI